MPQEPPMPPVVVPPLSRVRPRRTGLRWGLAVGAGVIVATLLSVAPAAGALYKWTDASGRVVYSDQPPPGNVKVEMINAPPPPADPNAAKDLANKELELQKKKQVRAEDETKATKARVDANMKRQECDRARGQMIALGRSSQVVVYTTNARGERIAMDDAALLAERQRLDYWINQNCQNLPPN
jgi:hypothetical protein